MVEVTEPETRIGIDTPAGFVEARVSMSHGRAERVRFRNVPSFVAKLDQRIDVEGVGNVRYDLAFGGAFYAYVDAASVGLACDPQHVGAAIEKGRAIKAAESAISGAASRSCRSRSASCRDTLTKSPGAIERAVNSSKLPTTRT